MQNLRRGINLILVWLALASPLTAADTAYLMTLDGVYSMGQKYLPDSTLSPYALEGLNSTFTDFGGRFLRTGGDWGFGFSSHLYSAFGARVAGSYRLALGWVPLQARVRKTWFGEWFITEFGTGPAFGFGAAEFVVNPASGGPSETRYHRYNEWGWMTSALVGADLRLHGGLSLQLHVEGAWLYARIRNPRLTESDNINAAQFFLRPGIAVALRF